MKAEDNAVKLMYRINVKYLHNVELIRVDNSSFKLSTPVLRGDNDEFIQN